MNTLKRFKQSQIDYRTRFNNMAVGDTVVFNNKNQDRQIYVVKTDHDAYQKRIKVWGCDGQLSTDNLNKLLSIISTHIDPYGEAVEISKREMDAKNYFKDLMEFGGL